MGEAASPSSPHFLPSISPPPPLRLPTTSPPSTCRTLRRRVRSRSLPPRDLPCTFPVPSLQDPAEESPLSLSRPDLEPHLRAELSAAFDGWQRGLGPYVEPLPGTQGGAWQSMARETGQSHPSGSPTGLPSKPLISQLQLGDQPAARRPLVAWFVHVPKTAGSYVSNFLTQKAGRSLR